MSTGPLQDGSSSMLTVASMFAVLLNTVACSEGSLRRLRTYSAVITALTHTIKPYPAAWHPSVAQPGSKYRLRPGISNWVTVAEMTTQPEGTASCLIHVDHLHLPEDFPSTAAVAPKQPATPAATSADMHIRSMSREHDSLHREFHHAHVHR